MSIDGSLLATKKLNVLGGAVIRYASDPPRVPAVLRAGCGDELVLVAGGCPQERTNKKNERRTVRRGAGEKDVIFLSPIKEVTRKRERSLNECEFKSFYFANQFTMVKNSGSRFDSRLHSASRLKTIFQTD